MVERVKPPAGTPDSSLPDERLRRFKDKKQEDKKSVPESPEIEPEKILNPGAEENDPNAQAPGSRIDKKA